MSLILRHPQRTTSAATGNFRKTQQQPTASLLRRNTTVSPFIPRSSTDVCSSASEQTVTLPTNNRSTRYPFVATRQVSSAPRRRACEIGDRWPLQDWTIGPCCLRNQPPSRPFSRIVLTNEVEMLKFKNTHMDAK